MRWRDPHWESSQRVTSGKLGPMERKPRESTAEVAPSIITTVFAASLMLANGLLLRLKCRKPVDGWRRGAAVSLRMESATFILSAFNLQPMSDASSIGDMAAMQAHVMHGLFEFLKSEREFHLC